MRKSIWIVGIVIMITGLFACNSNDASEKERVFAIRADEIGDYGADCFMYGEFVTGESDQTTANVNVLEDIYTDEELAQIKEVLGEEVYEDMFVTTTENGKVEISGCVLHECIGLYYRAYVPGAAGLKYYNMIICENGTVYGEIGPGPDGTFFTNNPEAMEMPYYKKVDLYMTFREFKNYINKIAPDMQVGDVIELPTDLDYFFALGEDAREHIRGTDILSVRIESSHILNHPSGKVFLVLSYADQYYTNYPENEYVEDPVLTETDWLYVYDITDDELRRTDIWYDIEIVGEVGIDRIEAVRTVDMLGTYQCYKDYALDERGRLLALSEGFVFEPHASGNGNLKVKKELPVSIDGAECVINPGEEIIITGGSVNDKEIYFRLVSTGEEGTIFYEEDFIGCVYINGIEQYEYFENLLELQD